MRMTIKQATTPDVPTLLDLYRELHPSDPPLPLQNATAVWEQITAQAGRAILLAVRDATPAGTADCLVVPNLTRSGRPFMVVENVVVAAAARRSGVGSALMAAAVELARESNCYKIQLVTNSRRETTHSFYAACGFKPMAQGYRLYLT
ncbi:MAG: GNAT family N-acetyltransferase [Kibdelosporangium sp.]